MIVKTAMRRLLLLSSSRTHAQPELLAHAREEITAFLQDVSRVLFVPYALADHDAYTKLVREAFAKMGFRCAGCRPRVARRKCA